MYRVVQAILVLTALFGAFDAFHAITVAETIMHQLYGALSLLVFVVSTAGIGIISAVMAGKPEPKKETASGDQVPG